MEKQKKGFVGDVGEVLSLFRATLNRLSSQNSQSTGERDKNASSSLNNDSNSKPFSQSNSPNGVRTTQRMRTNSPKPRQRPLSDPPDDEKCEQSSSQMKEQHEERDNSPSSRVNDEDLDDWVFLLRARLMERSLPTRGEEVEPTFAADIFDEQAGEEDDQEEQGTSIARMNAFLQVLGARKFSMEDLRNHCVALGIPVELRERVWKILLGHSELAEVQRRRRRYWEWVDKYYNFDDCKRSPEEMTLMNQIRVDIPRTNPTGFSRFFRNDVVSEALTRILYIWSYRHPDVNYFQGLNELPAAFFVVFTASYFGLSHYEDLNLLPEILLEQEDSGAIEADVYWCFDRLVHALGDHCTRNSIQQAAMVKRLRETIAFANPTLYKHLEQYGIDFIHFSYRWVICLLVRELPLRSIIHLWDSVIAEVFRTPDIYTYINAAFLNTWAKRLMEFDCFEKLLMFLQHLPTSKWQRGEIRDLLDRSYNIMKTERTLSLLSQICAVALVLTVSVAIVCAAVILYLQAMNSPNVILRPEVLKLLECVTAAHKTQIRAFAAISNGTSDAQRSPHKLLRNVIHKPAVPERKSSPSSSSTSPANSSDNGSNKSDSKNASKDSNSNSISSSGDNNFRTPTRSPTAPKR